MTNAERACIRHWLRQASTSSAVVSEALAMAVRANREDREDLEAAALEMAMKGQACFDQAAGYLQELCRPEKAKR